MIQKVFLFIFIILSNFLNAQLVETIVPKEPIVVGSAFQVQYIVHNADELQKIEPPKFKGFTVIAGPRIYKGYQLLNGVKKEVQNIVYTLIADKTGVLNIEGAVVFFSWGELTIKDEKVVVVANSIVQQNLQHIFATDIQDIEKNIFVKVETDKKTVYVGEPVVATFTLYASLPSVSEVIKNPGFYGFSIIDMMGYFERKNVAKVIDGKMFETVILRKVQLYPMQAGELEIEEMEVQNEVEVMDPETLTAKNINYNISSKPVNIKVKELPVSKQPKNFNGAVGMYEITAQLLRKQLAANEQGKLIVTISGQGNFIQLAEPKINWPKGIDVFEPQVKQKVQNDKSPTLGLKTFEYSFIANDTGQKVIPAIEFSFFDPESSSYITHSTKSFSFTVLPGKKKSLGLLKTKENNSSNWVIILIVFLIVVALLAIWLRIKNKKTIKPIETTTTYNPTYAEKIEKIEEDGFDKKNYLDLQKILNEYIHEKYQPSSTLLSNTIIINELEQNNVQQETITNWKEVLKEIETVVYTNITTQSFHEIKQKAIELVK